MIAQFNEFEAATSLLAEPDAGRALPRLKALVSQAPDNLAFRLELARAYELSGDRASAVRIYRENVTLAPNDARGWMNLAVALMRQGGDTKEARSAVQESLRLDPNRSEAHNILGVVLALSGEAEEAATEFRRAVAIDPRNAQAYNNLGESLRGVGDTAGALSAYRRAESPGIRAPRNKQRCCPTLIRSRPDAFLALARTRRFVRRALRLLRTQGSRASERSADHARHISS